MDDRPDNKPKEYPTGKDALTPQMRDQLQRSQRRNIIGGIVLGIILAVLGFFAGQNVKANSSDIYFHTPVVSEEVAHVLA